MDLDADEMPGTMAGMMRWHEGRSRIARATFVLAICLLCQGCVGVFVMRTKTELIQHPVIRDAANVDGVWERYPTKPADTPGYTTAWLEEHWGKPAGIRPVPGGDSGELWTYKFGAGWRGLIPAVIIPIPLVLPVDSDKVTFVVRDGRVVSAKQSRCHLSGFGASLVGPDGGGWAGAGW